MRHQALGDERASVLTLMAVALPVIIVVLALAMDFGNWYVHKSQIDNRAEAGALAAGVAYTTEFENCTPGSPAEGRIIAAAKRYAGATSGDFNTAPGDATNNIAVTVNGPGSPDPIGPCSPHPGGEYWTDVSAVAGGVPSFFSGFGVPTPKIASSARVAVMTAATASNMRPFVDGPCVQAIFTDDTGFVDGTADLAGSATAWNGTALSMPPNEVHVGIKVGCAANSPVYENMAYVHRVGTGLGFVLTNLQLTPSAPCTDPYFIPFDGAACTFSVTATVTGDPPSVQAALGPGGTQSLTRQGTSDVYAGGSFKVDPQGGNLSNGMIAVNISAGPALGETLIGGVRLQAGTAADQGSIARVTLDNHAQTSGSPIGQITVSLRFNVIDSGANCSSETIANQFKNGCAGPFKVKVGGGPCNTATPPFDCVAVSSGGLANLSSGGNSSSYNVMWAPDSGGGPQCTSNNWPNIPPGDPRLVTVFRTDALPATPVPITGLRAFYVTGWDNAPSSCGSSGTGGQNDRQPSGVLPGAVWGHYVKLVLPSANGTASAIPCAVGSPADELIACVAVLVR